MPKPEPLSTFELDFIRLCHANGQTDQAIADQLRRTRNGIWKARRRMTLDGTINQLPLPGFEPRVEDMD